MSGFSNDKKLIKDYIDGNDTSVDVDILENDLDFMKAVIDYSGDQNLYNLCSDDIKYNCEMIKFLIERFHENSEFIINLVLDFLDNYDHTHWYKEYDEDFFNYSQTITNELEVLITIDKYLEQKLDERIITIKFKLKGEFLKFRITLESAFESGEDNRLKQELGKGFYLVLMMFPTSYLIKDYYAVSIIDEILRECPGNTLEDKIHRMIDDSTKPESAMKVLINLVNKHDIELSNYIIARQEPFKEYLTEISNIIVKWDEYNDKVLNDKIYFILDIISDYYYKNEHLLCMDEFECVQYYATLLNLEEKFKALDPISYKCVSVPDPLKGKTYHDKKMFHELTPIIKNIMDNQDSYALNEERTSKKQNNICTFRPKR